MIARNRVATATRTGDPASVRLARQNLAEAHVQAAIERVATDFPPLRPDQRDRLVILLRGGAR